MPSYRERLKRIEKRAANLGLIPEKMGKGLVLKDPNTMNTVIHLTGTNVSSDHIDKWERSLDRYEAKHQQDLEKVLKTIDLRNEPQPGSKDRIAYDLARSKATEIALVEAHKQINKAKAEIDRLNEDNDKLILRVVEAEEARDRALERVQRSSIQQQQINDMRSVLAKIRQTADTTLSENGAANGRR